MKKKTGVIMIIALLVIVLAMVFGFKIKNDKSDHAYEEVIKNIFYAIEEENLDSYYSYMEKSYLAFDDEEVQILKEATEEAMNKLENIYGENFKITFSIKKEEDFLKKAKNKNAINKIYEITGLKESEVEKIYSVVYTYNISGNNKSKTDENRLIMVKCNNKWYPVQDLIMDIVIDSNDNAEVEDI